MYRTEKFPTFCRVLNRFFALSTPQNVGWSLILIVKAVVKIDINNKYSPVEDKYEFHRIPLEELKSKYIYYSNEWKP